jgi:hypothetical protein
MSKDIREMIDKVKNFKGSINEQREVFNKLYHGTDIESAMDIQKNGVDISKGYGGYFGWGFYTTPDFDLAKSNYADFSDDEEGGVILEFELLPTANILDLNDSDDFELWKKYSKRINDENLYKELTEIGIDGLWDNSFDGVVIYNPKVLVFKNIHK